LAPLPPSNTDRLFVDYDFGGFDHTILCRFTAPNTQEDAQQSVHDLLTAITPSLYAITILGARVAAEGSNVTSPVGWAHDSAYGDGSGSAAHSADYYDFIGRSADGRKVRVAVFAARQTLFGDNYRAAPGENGDLDDGVAVLVATEGTFLTISGEPPIWHTYINSGTNAYWRNKIR